MLSIQSKESFCNESYKQVQMYFAYLSKYGPLYQKS